MTQFELFEKAKINTILDAAKEYVSCCIAPIDIFKYDELLATVFDTNLPSLKKAIVEYVKDTGRFEPEDLFTKDELKEWARSNDFTRLLSW